MAAAATAPRKQVDIINYPQSNLRPIRPRGQIPHAKLLPDDKTFVNIVRTIT